MVELWERTAALASLDELLGESGHAGRVALVAGEAGLGKTALVSEFAARSGARARVLWGVCDPLLTPRALGPLHDIGRQAGGVLADRLAAAAPPGELFAALLDELSGPRQRARPVVMVEDAHWADEATLDLLVFLARRIERVRALLVLTYRDDELGAEHPLRRALSVLPRQAVRKIPLAPLSRACVGDLAARAGRSLLDVYELTGGNPLLVTELLASDDHAVPATVRDLVLARLRTLPPAARDVARLVAVMPTRAPAALVANDWELVEHCVAAGVLVESGDRVSYRHELLRRAVEDSLSPARSAALHRQALALLSDVDGVDPAQLVHHARCAGDEQALLRYGRIAATSAAAQSAHREATAHYRTVRPLLHRLPAAERAEMLEAYGLQAYLAGAAEEGLDARRAALAEREALGDRERVGENLRWVSRLAWWAGRSAEAREAAFAAVDVLEAEPPGVQLAMAYSNRAQLHMLARDIDEAVKWGERARALADEIGDVDTSIHATINTASALAGTGDRASFAALREAHVRAAAEGLRDHATRALGNLASDLIELGETAEAAPVVDAALAYAIEHDLDGYVQYLHGVRAGVRLGRLDWAGALADAEESLARPARMGVAVVPALVAYGRIASLRGTDGALSTLDRAADLAYSIDELQRIGPVAIARAEYFMLAGDADRAEAEAHRALESAIELAHPWFLGELAYLLWRIGRPLRGIAFDGPYRKLIDGDTDGAASELASRGRDYARLDALAAGAIAAGDTARAAEALRALDGLGAARVAGWVRAQLRQRGVTGVPRGPRPTTAANAAGLTTRQLEVLGLLADGYSTAEIAGRLTLSRKTVEHHISAILDKLGVGNRSQAIAAAHRLNIGTNPQDGAGRRA